MDNSGNSNISRFGSSSSSNPSNFAFANGNVKPDRSHNQSEEKHLEPTHRDNTEKAIAEKKFQGIAQNQQQNVNIIEDYGVSKEIPIIEQK